MGNLLEPQRGSLADENRRPPGLQTLCAPSSGVALLLQRCFESQAEYRGRSRPILTFKTTGFRTKSDH